MLFSAVNMTLLGADTISQDIANVWTAVNLTSGAFTSAPWLDIIPDTREF